MPASPRNGSTSHAEPPRRDSLVALVTGQRLDEVRRFSEDVLLMYGWLNGVGYQADIGALRRRHPELRTLRSWLEQTASRLALAA